MRASSPALEAGAARSRGNMAGRCANHLGLARGVVLAQPGVSLRHGIGDLEGQHLPVALWIPRYMVQVFNSEINECLIDRARVQVQQVNEQVDLIITLLAVMARMSVIIIETLVEARCGSIIIMWRPLA